MRLRYIAPVLLMLVALAAPASAKGVYVEVYVFGECKVGCGDFSGGGGGTSVGPIDVRYGVGPVCGDTGGNLVMSTDECEPGGDNLLTEISTAVM